MLSILFIAAISLQNPSPSRGIVRQNEQTNASNTQQRTTQEQRGTEPSPIFVEQVPTSKTQEEIEQETKERNERASNDRNLVKFTGELFWATVFIGIVGLLQVFMFGYQGIQLKRTVVATEANANAIISSERAVWLSHGCRQPNV